MARWLFSSTGKPIAFINADYVYSCSGHFIGRLNGDEVWHGSYKGEICKDDRFLYKTTKGTIIRGTPGTPGTPSIPGIPGNKGSISIPAGYRDVTVDK
jgi:hypothetical protein